MANSWHYKTSLKDEHFGVESDGQVSELQSNVIQISTKNTLQKIQNWIDSIHFKSVIGTVLKTFAFVIPLVATFFIMEKVGERQTLNSNAGSNQARLFFQASSISLPPDTSIQMLVNTDDPVSFIRTEVVFDPTKIRLLNDVDLGGSPLKRVISITPFTEANMSGKLVIVLAQDPANTTPVIGDFTLGVLSLSANNSEFNLSTDISYNLANSQIVNSNSSIFSITSLGMNVLVNPSVTPTVAPTPTQAPVVTASPSPVVSATPLVKSCNYCFKNKCNSVCDSKDNKLMCPDCSN